MVVAVAAGTPLHEQLNAAVQAKLVDLGWTAGDDDSSPLSEYIVLMLVNGKTEDQITAELSGDLLGLGDNDNSAPEFAKWLFSKVTELSGGGAAPAVNHANGSVPTQDEEMKDEQAAGSAPPASTASPTGIPTGPRAEREGQFSRDRRRPMIMQISKAMHRTPDALHRVRNASHERIDKREPPRGPRNSQNGPPTGPASMQMPGMPPYGNGPGMGGSGRNGSSRARGGAQMAGFRGMNAQQQQMLMAQTFNGAQADFGPQMFPTGPGEWPMIPYAPEFAQGMMMPQPGWGAGSFGNFSSQPGRPLEQRINPTNIHQIKPVNSNGNHEFHQQLPQEFISQSKPPSLQKDANGNEQTQESTTAEVAMDEAGIINDNDRPTSQVPCKFGSNCLNPECKFGHASPAGVTGFGPAVFLSIPGSQNVGDCEFGISCRNRKCVLSHPSPASRPQQKSATSEIECKFFPNCTNPNCPFKHPDMPACRFGASCTRPGCHFRHDLAPEDGTAAPKCRFNPCLNPTCRFTHDAGQQRLPEGFKDKVWVREDSTSDRQFVDFNAKEELIIPGQEPVSTSQEEASVEARSNEDVPSEAASTPTITAGPALVDEIA